MDLEATDAPPPPSSGSQSTQRYDILRKRIFTMDVRAPAWVEDEGTIAAILYKDEVPTLGREEAGAFVADTSAHDGGSASVVVRVAPDAPVPWDRATVRLRFRVDAGETPKPPAQPAPSTQLRAGQVGWVRFQAKRREVPMVPAGAVLESGEGPYVLVVSADSRSLVKRPVEIGRTFGGMIAVVSGLRHRERVLLTDTFFLDAERRSRREQSIEVTP
jgi:hypothetical protein